MLMMPFLMPTAMSSPLVTWAWFTLNSLTWLASSEDVASRSYQDGLMLALLLASHCTVTPLCAASYWLVSFFRPALSAAVIGPVFGGSTALMTVDPPWADPEEPPLPEQPAARPPASSKAAPIDKG